MVSGDTLTEGHNVIDRPASWKALWDFFVPDVVPE